MKSAFLLIIFCIVFTASFPQSNNLYFKHIRTNEGLSQNFITTIFQDSKGYMWIGTTDNGLNKYDGYTFTIYQRNSDVKNSISANRIQSITEDSRGYIWVGTGDGLNRFDRKSEKFVSFKNDPDDPYSLSQNSINAIYPDDNGNLWIGIDNGGLNYFDHKSQKFTRYLEGQSVRRIYKDHQGILFVATTGSGLYIYDQESTSFHNFTHKEDDTASLSSDLVSSIFEDSRNNVWIGTYDNGINLFDRKSRNFRHIKKDVASNGLSTNRILSIGEDPEGNIWIGTENNGLNIYNPQSNSFTKYTYDPSNTDGLNSNSIYSIERDAQGNMWLGTHTGGLNFFNWQSHKFTHYSQRNTEGALNNNVIYNMYEDSQGNLLIGTDGGGLNILDLNTEKFSYMLHEAGNKNSICGNNVLAVIEDSFNNFWIGTWGEGLTIYNKDKKTYKHFKNNPADETSLSGNNVWTIFEDRERNIWIGTYWGGLSLYNREKDNFTQFTREGYARHGFKSINVNEIFQDKSGAIWVATFDGLALFDKESGRFSYYEHDPRNKNGINNNQITDIHEDNDGDLWIGTDKGLNFFDRKNNTFMVYSKKDGFPNDQIKGILNDDNGNLWINTNGGISKFNIASRSIKSYTVADGLPVTEFTENAHRSRDGSMYFSGINGFVKFNPSDLKNANFTPPVVFTDFQIFNEKVEISNGQGGSPLTQHISETDAITLSYKESVISFEFAALNYTSELKKQYSYMLEGFDEKWNNVGLKRTATYTNLEPGNYTLKVRTLDNEGEWSDNVKTLDIKIIPPFWKTWWFRILFLVSVTGGAVSWYRSRINSIKRQKILLEEKVEIRTSELMKANEELTEQKEEILSQREKIEDLYEDITDSIRAAEAIQGSILPSKEEIRKQLPEFFAFYKPKDIVSGDFYWFAEKDGKCIIAAIDCTGHGVSGALMSIKGHYLLNQILVSLETIEAGEILQQLNKLIIQKLNPEENEISEGMDVCLCVVDKNLNKMQYAGAKSPLYVFRKGEIIEIKGDKSSVGGKSDMITKEFKNHHIDLQQDDMVYLFSDGYADQFGGPDGEEKFMYFRFRELLAKIANESADKQQELLDEHLVAWMGSRGQLDDIMVLGFRVKN